MIRLRARSFAKDEEASATIEFLLVFLAFMGMMLFVIETSLYLFYMASLEKAAEAGARAAVVSQPVVANFTTTLQPDDGIRGESCAAGADVCRDPDPFGGPPTCNGRTGINCNTARLQRLVDHMRHYNGAITRRNVTVVYDEVGIGFAGGPNVPMVTVRIDRMPFRTGIFGLLLENMPNGMGTLPARAATMTGEDLAP